MSPAFVAVGLLGKAPCQGDFLRINAPAPVVHQFHRWLEEGVGSLPSALRAFPAQPLRFVFTAAGEKRAIAGVMAASVDSVGRQFPLSVFCEISALGLQDRLGSIPALFAPFCDAATALISEAATLSAREMSEMLETLPAPNEEAVRAAETGRNQALNTLKVGPLISAIGREPADMASYALKTVGTACLREKGKEPAKANVILDCPLSADMGPLPWLELAQRRLGWKGAIPSLFWFPGSRLLLSLGPPTASTIGFLANPEATGTRLWPLRVSQPAAIAAAVKALTPGQRKALSDEETPLGSLIDQLSV